MSEEKRDERSNKAWVITRMAGVALYGWIKVAVSWSVGRPLSEVNVESPESVTTRNVEFRLHEFRKTTPEEMFKKKLKGEQYSEALQLAEQYNIDTDVVYEEQWNKYPITKFTVRDYLSKVRNTDWALQECLHKVSNRADGCQELIKYGLQLTDVAELDRDALVQQENRIRSLCEKRVNLLHFQEVLLDYEEMLQQGADTSEKFEASFFARIRVYSFLDIAVHLAQSCRFTWLDVFLSRHKDVLYEHWLPILSCIPEVVSVSEFQFLLPRLVNGKARVWKRRSSQALVEADEVFNEEFGVLDIINRLNTDSTLYDVEPDLLDYRLSTDPPLPTLLSRWYEKRCWDIEQRTGVPDLVLDFVSKAVEFGFGDLDRLQRDIVAFCKLVYDCGDSGRSLEQFQQADVFTMVKNLMDQASGETTVKYMEQRVIPYIIHSEDYGRCEGKEVFTRFLVEESKSSLKLVSSLFDSWKVRQKIHHVLVRQLKITEFGLAELVERCVTVCERTGEQLLVPAAKLLSCLDSPELTKEGTSH